MIIPGERVDRVIIINLAKFGTKKYYGNQNSMLRRRDFAQANWALRDKCM